MKNKYHIVNLPSFLQPTHSATLPTAESSIAVVSESASHTGVEDKVSQPSTRLFIVLGPTATTIAAPSWNAIS